MPGVRGFSGLMYLRAQYPSLPIVVVSANDDPAVIRRCMEFGASGFIPKTLGIEALRRRSRGCCKAKCGRRPTSISRANPMPKPRRLIARLSTLTPQQVRVLMMLSGGLLNKQIAYELGVSEATVKAHVSAILQKLGVESRTQAVIAAGKIEAGQWPQVPARERWQGRHSGIVRRQRKRHHWRPLAARTASPKQTTRKPPTARAPGCARLARATIPSGRCR